MVKNSLRIYPVSNMHTTQQEGNENCTIRQLLLSIYPMKHPIYLQYLLTVPYEA